MTDLNKKLKFLVDRMKCLYYHDQSKNEVCPVVNAVISSDTTPGKSIQTLNPSIWLLPMNDTEREEDRKYGGGGRDENLHDSTQEAQEEESIQASTLQDEGVLTQKYGFDPREKA